MFRVPSLNTSDVGGSLKSGNFGDQCMLEDAKARIGILELNPAAESELPLSQQSEPYALASIQESELSELAPNSFEVSCVDLPTMDLLARKDGVIAHSVV